MGDVPFHLPAHIIAGQGHVEHGIKSQLTQTFPDHRGSDVAVELGVEGGSGQSNVHFVLFQFIQGISPSFHGPHRTAADAFPAVDASIRQDLCLATAHTDGLNQTLLHTDQAPGTALPIHPH